MWTMSTRMRTSGRMEQRTSWRKVRGAHLREAAGGVAERVLRAHPPPRTVLPLTSSPCFFLSLPERPALHPFPFRPMSWGVGGCGERTLGSQGPRESLLGVGGGQAVSQDTPHFLGQCHPFPVIFRSVRLIHFGFSPNHLVPGLYF